MDPTRRQEVLGFKARYKPRLTYDLGDIIDTAAFRNGAKGSKDETTEIEPDELAAEQWILEYAPDRITWGNHDWRLQEWRGHHNAVISYAANAVWNKLQSAVAKVGAQTRPYILKDNWFFEGGVHFGHGFYYNVAAVRDHAETTGTNTVIAHLHRAEMQAARVLKNCAGYCVGTLANVDKMSYADRQRAKLGWSAGLVFGELDIENSRSRIWQVRAEPGEPLIFPPGLN